MEDNEFSGCWVASSLRGEATYRVKEGDPIWLAPDRKFLSLAREGQYLVVCVRVEKIREQARWPVESEHNARRGPPSHDL